MPPAFNLQKYIIRPIGMPFFEPTHQETDKLPVIIIKNHKKYSKSSDILNKYPISWSDWRWFKVSFKVIYSSFQSDFKFLSRRRSRKKAALSDKNLFRAGMFRAGIAKKSYLRNLLRGKFFTQTSFWEENFSNGERRRGEDFFSGRYWYWFFIYLSDVTFTLLNFSRGHEFWKRKIKVRAAVICRML